MSQSIKQDSIEKAYLVGVHRYAFRPGEKAEIIAVKSMKPPGNYEWRFVYVVQYDDKYVDYVAWVDVIDGNYILVNQMNADLGILPEVKY